MGLQEIISEQDIQKQIMYYLKDCGIFHFRNNAGRKHNLQFGIKGGSDILGLLKNGRFLAIEVKKDGGKLSKQQELFLEVINKNNGLAFVARSLNDVVEKLQGCG